MIRVVVADDSLTARSLLVAILTSDPEIVVVAEAGNGREAIDMVRKFRPDLVTMDVCMPVMDGFEATKEIMITMPTPIVIVTSSVVIENVATSMNTLRAGPWPFGQAGRPGVAGIRGSRPPPFGQRQGAAQVKVVRHWRQVDHSAKVRPGPLGTGRVKMVAIATSTGGPGALHRILLDLPGDFPVPILIVQHITKGFAPGLAEWLNKESPLHVKLAQEGETLQSHTVYLAPDDYHLGIANPTTILLDQGPPMGGFRPSGTFLFQSAAKVLGAGVVAVILTGMGEDGLAGLRAVQKAGGRIIAQDEKTSIIFGMPGAAVAAGVADQVLPLEGIATRLMEMVRGL